MVEWKKPKGWIEEPLLAIIIHNLCEVSNYYIYKTRTLLKVNKLGHVDVTKHWLRQIFCQCEFHNIIQIHNIVLWDWHYSTKYSQIFPTFGLIVGNIKAYFVEYCLSHITLLWIWIMLCLCMSLYEQLKLFKPLTTIFKHMWSLQLPYL